MDTRMVGRAASVFVWLGSGQTWPVAVALLALSPFPVRIGGTGASVLSDSGGHQSLVLNGRRSSAE
jgi:hypothetical protein